MENKQLMDEQFVLKIFNRIAWDCPLVRHYKNDVLQEIRLVLLTADEVNAYKRSKVAVRRLMTNYGFSRRRGKNNYHAFYNHPLLPDEQNELIDRIEELYAFNNLPAKVVCNQLGIKYSNRVHMALSKMFPKKTK